MIFDIEQVEDIIGYKFNDKMLLRKCFIHSSYANEHQEESYDKLEYFGDAILEFVVTEYLYNSVAGDEGFLTNERQKIVSNDAEYYAVKQLGLDRFLLVGNGQKNNGKAGCKNTDESMKMYANILESLICGIYLDGGLDKAKRFIKKTLIDYYESQCRKAIKKIKSYKTELQEYVQKRKLGKIEYLLIYKKGPDHLPTYRVAMKLNGKTLAESEGTSIKKAEETSAEKAYNKLKNRMV